MKFRERYRRLSPWSKIGLWGSIASIISLGIALFPSQHREGVAIRAPVQGPVIISQGQVGGQIAQSITNVGPQPRQVSAEALAALAASLRREPPQIYEIEVVDGDAEAKAIAFQIQAGLNSAGWTCSTFANSIFPQPITGLTISIPRDSAAVSNLVDWARRAGLSPKVETLKDLGQVHILVGSQR